MIGAHAALFEAAKRRPPVDVSADIGAATLAIFGLVLLPVLFFVLRPALWRRLWFTRVDPRPAALMRIAFGVVVLWSLIDLLPSVNMLFTDEGLWPTALARKRYGGLLREVWDPEGGFASAWDFLRAVFRRFSVFHLRSDPPFVFAVYGLTSAAIVGLIVGWRTRLMTICAWILVNTIYGYSPIFYTGGDTVIRVFLFLGIFLRWGEAYSLDAWRRRRRAILRGGAQVLPEPSLIPAWPVRLMMLQLAIIYGATGALKSGITWFDGTALYYALNLDHFYRHPVQIPFVALLQWSGILPLLTWITRIWETLFPLALVGLGLQAFERERGKTKRLWGDASRLRRLLSYACVAGFFILTAYLGALATAYYYDVKVSPWPSVDRMTMARFVQVAALILPALVFGAYLGIRRYRPRLHSWLLTWVLGRRLWLGGGVVLHLGIELLMNVGTFVQVMLAIYPLWLRGAEVDALWRWVGTRALPPGRGGAPLRVGVRGWLRAPARRLGHREERPYFVVLHGGDDGSIRRVALLRCWDLAGRLRFEPAEGDAEARRLRLRAPDGSELVDGPAGAKLCRLLPGLWIAAPWSLIPGLGSIVGGVALAVLGQGRSRGS